MKIGTVIITKDRNACLAETLAALDGSELAEHPVVIVNNGSINEDPHEVTRRYSYEVVDLPENLGIVGARFYAHRVASAKGWTHYCFLQDDFALRLHRPGWLADTMAFIEQFGIDYCRLTTRECALAEDEHWVKGELRVKTGLKRWNCSHVQMPKRERVGRTDFILTDKHYSDWAHIMSIRASTLLFDSTNTNFDGKTVTDLLLTESFAEAVKGAVKTEFDSAVRHWIAYAMGQISCTGIVDEKPCWCGIFEHQTRISACDYRDLPQAGHFALRQALEA